MAINKVVYGNTTLIDLTDSTLSQANEILSGVTAYDRTGTKITGTLEVYPDGDNLGYGITTGAIVGTAVVGTTTI